MNALSSQNGGVYEGLQMLRSKYLVMSERASAATQLEWRWEENVP